MFFNSKSFLTNGKYHLMVYILFLILLYSGTATASKSPDFPDLFAHEQTYIAPDKTVGKLVITGANVIVAGNVTDGILVVDGNLSIQSGAKIRGSVIVLGGRSDLANDVSLEDSIITISSRGFPLAPIAVVSLIILGTVSLAILPFAAWLAVRLFNKAPLFKTIKRHFLAVQHHWPLLYIIGTLLLSTFMLTAFVEIAWKTLFRQTTTAFDNSMIWLVRYFASPAIDKAMIFITDLGYSRFYAILVVIVFLALAYLKRWREAAGLGICLGGGAFLNFVFKHLFERSRPELFRVTEAAGYSFPSGHAMVSLCFYGMLAFILARNIKSWRGRLTVISVSSLLIAAIGVSRIYLGVHYPTDVVAGYTAGSMWLAFCISLLMWWEHDREKKNR